MKKNLLIVSLSFFAYPSFSQLDNAAIRDLKAGRILHDTSYVYCLPFEQGKKFFLIQGWESKMSHKGELSLDFKMKPGNRICAAREGIVLDVKMDSDIGGLNDEYLDDGNHIVIRHSDGSCAAYWHLQKDGVLVKVGDTVQKGQWIGLSGNTGYSAFPHLHFQVYKEGNSSTTIPTRFLTRHGTRYLRPGKFYRSVR